MTVLADTSIWVNVLKLGVCGPGAELGSLLCDRQTVLVLENEASLWSRDKHFVQISAASAPLPRFEPPGPR